MATATKSRSAPSTNGTAVAKAKNAGGALTTAARSAKGPVLAAGAAAAGLVGGVALGSHLGTRRNGLSGLVGRRSRVLGVPLGRKTGLRRTVETVGEAARELGSATRQVSAVTDEIRRAREQLDQANRRSPIEVVLDRLTHRRGAHRDESQRERAGPGGPAGPQG